MKTITTFNGTIKLELQYENQDEKHILETFKDKVVTKITVKDGGGVVFELQGADKPVVVGKQTQTPLAVAVAVGTSDHANT